LHALVEGLGAKADDGESWHSFRRSVPMIAALGNAAIDGPAWGRSLFRLWLSDHLHPFALAE